MAGDYIAAVLASIRTRLICLVLAVLIPAVIAAVWASVSTYRRETSAVEETLRETTKALSLVVDREIQRRELVVRVLATSDSLATGDFAAFYRQAITVTADTGGSLLLVNEEGIVIDTSRPFSIAPATAPAVRPAALAREVRVSSLYRGVTGAMVSVDIPVVRQGRLWNLSLTLPTDQLQRVIADQSLPRGWTAAVLDSDGIVVARQPEPERWVGSPAHSTLREQIARQDEGFYDTVTLDGTRVVAFFSKSPRYGWAFAIGVPRPQMLESIRAALVQVGAISLVLTLLAVLAATWVGRGLVRSIRALHHHALALERGERVKLQPTGLRESDAVAQTLAGAAERLIDANRVLEMRVAEAVAETRVAQQKLLQSQKMEAIGQLTGGLAHDFNNLLQTLLSGQQMLAMMVRDPEAHKILESCDRAVRKAANLTRQLLGFGRRQEFRVAPVDLRDQILGMRELLTGALREDIKLSVDFAPDLWPVLVDATQLELAILNCSLNARDAMTDGGQLRISARNEKITAGQRPDGMAGEFVRLSIEDTGEGIPAEVLAKVFEPFFTTKEVGKGSGLGLAQVYGFATQSGGTVEIQSEVGRGTTIHLLLPRAAGEVVERHAAEPRPTAVSGRGKRVLFVEDDSLVADVVGSALAAMEFELLRVDNGDKALEVLRSDVPIDVVFSDIVMPGNTNGFDLARAAKRMRPDTRVVLATGYSDKGARIEGVSVLAKPYSISALAEALVPSPADTTEPPANT